MSSGASLRFASPPSVWGLYPRILAARKPAHLREGAIVPRIEARLDPVRVDPANLAQYRELCSNAALGTLPLAYPHLIASPLHLAVLASNAFPLKLLGLVHVQNRIEQYGPLDENAVDGAIETFIEGHRETDRGQEFELHTVWRNGDRVLWRETSTFLARRRKAGVAKVAPDDAGPAAGGRSVKRPVASDSRAEVAPAGARVRSTSFRAAAGLGRSYGLVSGDINPIHLFDVTARAFGFSGAIAHGMWTLARCAVELDGTVDAPRRVLDVQFKLPVYLPAWLVLESWSTEHGTGFALRDAQAERLHLVGSLQRAE
jgi:acyl dehydratase